MKTGLTLMAVAMLALPIFAADEPKKKESSAPAKTASAATAPAAKPQAAPAPATADSPLVTASKNRRARRNASRIVITNETLTKSGGNAHITTTASQRPIVVPPPPPKSLEERMAEQRAEQRRVEAIQAANRAKTEQERQAEIRKTRDILEDQEYSEDDIDADPAQAEYRAQQATEGKKSNEQKPPHR
jgi:hypothetical protein